MSLAPGTVLCDARADMPDVIVVGAGVSGLAFAWRAAAAGRKVLVLERAARVGGCLNSHRRPDGFWFEMGAHTGYNSYGNFLDLASAAGVAGRILRRGEARARFGLMRGSEASWLTPWRVLWELDWLEAALAFPAGMLHRRKGETVYSHYARLVGRKNYDRLLSPFFQAVPSQKADGFPAAGPGSLFKKRSRRRAFPRSYGFEGGLETVCDAAATLPGVSVETSVEVVAVARDGALFAAFTSDGRKLVAPVLAVAVAADRAVALLRDDFPELADALAKVRTVEVDSVGTVLRRDRCWMPEVAFLVPVDDVFHSVVTRDPFPHATLRAFTFHFRPGLSRDARIRRAAEILRVAEGELEPLVESKVVLPSPAPGHAELLTEIERCLRGGRLALSGNYFAGLAIEDCMLRSTDEWRRVGGERPL
ncbi:MAG TPA: FAD-dependent oxidoreductase [Anaeromyxobacter sp.]|nr:FAD-dependent oxidoreductase [Anaeromyxobacter sp.]